MVEHVRQLDGHPLDLRVGQLEAREAGDVENLVAIEHRGPILGDVDAGGRRRLGRAIDRRMSVGASCGAIPSWRSDR